MCRLSRKLKRILPQLVVARRDSWRMSDLQHGGKSEIQNGSRSNEVECAISKGKGEMRKMTTTRQQGRSFWALQGPGWLLLIWLVYAQGISAFGYELGVAMGTQEPVEKITEVGAAFWYGFALGDLLTYIPILFAGLIGHLLLILL